MAGGEIAALLGAVGLGGIITALVNGVFGKKQVAADVESKTVQNALALVEPYRAQVADVRKEMQDYVVEMRVQLADLRSRNKDLLTELQTTRVEAKATKEELAQVTRREREHLTWQGEMTAWAKTVQTAVAEGSNLHLPPPPDLATSRREFTRRDDFPTLGA